MKSLAVIVSLLFLTAIFSGPIALGVSRIRPKTRKGALTRRSVITVLGIWGTLNGMQFALAPVSLFPRLVGIFSVTTSVIALRKEYGFWQGLRGKLPPED